MYDFNCNKFIFYVATFGFIRLSNANEFQKGPQRAAVRLLCVIRRPDHQQEAVNRRCLRFINPSNHHHQQLQEERLKRKAVGFRRLQTFQCPHWQNRHYQWRTTNIRTLPIPIQLHFPVTSILRLFHQTHTTFRLITIQITLLLPQVTPLRWHRQRNISWDTRKWMDQHTAARQVRDNFHQIK